MAGLAAAWRLTEPGGPPVEVTVYQRGFRLGGKGASSRGVHGRIEEHGLHVWLGYYDNAFRLMRQCYGELDRERSDPGCPIQTWRDAFVPAGVVGLGSDEPDGWHDWLAAFPDDDRLPGEPAEGDEWFEVADLLRRGLALVARFGASLDGQPAPPPRAVLASTPTPPLTSSLLGDLARGLGAGLRTVASDQLAATRAAQFVELFLVMVRGILADGLLVRGFGAVDDEDLRDWLARHGASAAALDAPFVRGMYDLGFAYEDGDHGRPSFSAGTGLLLTGRTFLDYKGSLFWKMRAGMGDVVFAPLYEALGRRGVRFELFHRLDGVHPDGNRIGAITLGRQVALRPGIEEYEPLTRVLGLPVFPDQPDLDQLDAPPELLGQPLEHHGCAWPDAGVVRLEAGRDFDDVVLAVSVGMLPYTCGELLQRDERWRAMVAGVRTVATQAMQLWLHPDERALGWRHAGASVTGCGAPFDTFASMSQTLAFETWPDGAEPRTAASFCAVLEEKRTGATPDDALAEVAAGADRFLDERLPNLWPASAGPDGFRSELLAGRYLRANVDPSDRYVQAVPGSGRVRLRADDSGYTNLALAGDWIDTGLNAGCIEAAVLGGLQAGNAVLGRPLSSGTTGFRPKARVDA